MIECDLLSMASLDGESDRRKKYGRYHGSCFWNVREFGSKKWVVAAYIKPNDPQVLDSASVEDIAKGCIEYLNQPPPRKKYAKRQPKPKYGNLEYYSSKLVEVKGVRCISALIVVDSRKNKNFWGKGRTIV